MALKDILGNLFPRKKTTEEFVGELTAFYTDEKASGAKNPIDDTVSKFLQDIENSPNKSEIAEEVLKALIKNKLIPDRVAEKVSGAIIDSEELSSNIVTRAIASTGENLKDSTILSIMNEGNFGSKERLSMIRSLGSEEGFEKAIGPEINRLLKKCNTSNDNEIITGLEALIKTHNDSGVDYDIIPQIEKVIACRMAENYYKFGSTMTSKFAGIVGYSRLLEDDIATKVNEEYKKIETKRGVKGNRFNKETFGLEFMGHFGNWIGGNYRNTDVSIVIPQSEKMKKITDEEEKRFIREIEIGAGRKLTKREKKSIKAQIRGVIDDSLREELLISALKKSVRNPELDSIITVLIEVFSNPDELKTVLKMKEKGLLSKISSFSPDARAQVIEMVGETLNNRQFLGMKNTNEKAGSPKGADIHPKQLGENSKPLSNDKPPIDGDPADGK